MSNTQYTELWSYLNKKSRTIEMKMDALTRKRTGSYYTDLALTDIMMSELVEHLKVKNPAKKLCKYRFLEPCVGTGNFVFSYIKAVKATGINATDAKMMFDNIYVADINLEAFDGYKESLKKMASLFWNIELSDEYFEQHMGTGLLVDVTAAELSYIHIHEVFPAEVVGNGFDIVATNPPYKNLKAERGHYTNDNDYAKDKDKYAIISNVIAKHFKYSTDGVLNLYKLFVEEIIDRYANETALISLLIPASILSDKTCIKLRTHILEDNQLLSVKVIGEGSNYINAQQALSAILLQKGSKTDKVTVSHGNHLEDTAEIAIKDILNQHTGNAIVAVSSKEYQILKTLRQYPVVRELPFVVNLRGELDLTVNKHHIVPTNTGYPLVRGRNIGYYHLLASSENEFVTDTFVHATKKNGYITKERIICQQIANMNKDRRVTFALAPKNYVLGNSCNFISVEENPYGITIYTLLGLFNTKIINWLFKLTSSNNHINNYEIDGFPIPLKAPELEKISILAKLYFDDPNDAILEEIEQLAYKAYGISISTEKQKMDRNQYIDEYTHAIKHLLPQITEEEASSILNGQLMIDNFLDGLSKFDANVIKGITIKYTTLLQGQLLNHTTFKLSDLDLEMIQAVPPGGSWKDIPMETVEKSKRLKRITQTGGRTTLYGRIDYNKPSYTITTYFNRPGNGTYVHPVHDRVLTVREAARFQTFKDDYYFFGNKTQHLKQVGNAVPALLAYQIACAIKKKTGCSKSIDLFCGAGGMTVGFKAAGIKSLLSNDIEESACITLKINNPEINVLCADITKAETKDAIEKAALHGGADILCGGPPCQGFSLAGFRADDDPRNQLFRDFIDIVKRINPKVIVFENVEGLLSYQGGKTYREVHALFTKLGYRTEGRTLMASDYAVPQKRKRVIILCTRNDLPVSPEELFPIPITIDELSQVTAKETISDLETVPWDNTARYVDNDESDILKFFKGKITYEEYVNLKTSNQRMDKEVDEPYEQLSFADLL